MFETFGSTEIAIVALVILLLGGVAYYVLNNKKSSCESEENCGEDCEEGVCKIEKKD
jgi:hypothetical protein